MFYALALICIAGCGSNANTCDTDADCPGGVCVSLAATRECRPVAGGDMAVGGGGDDLGGFTDGPPILLDALEGDASLFARADEVEASWAICDPILDEWQRSDEPPLHIYEPSLWGPEESTEWMAQQGRQWFDICPVLH